MPHDVLPQLPSDIVWVNGNFVQRSMLNGNPSPRAIHYQNSVFDGMLARKNGGEWDIFAVRKYLTRLVTSAQRAGIVRTPEVPNAPELMYTVPKLKEVCYELLRLNPNNPYIRPWISLDSGFLGVSMPSDGSAFVMVEALSLGEYYPNETLSVYITEKHRRPSDALSYIDAKGAGSTYNIGLRVLAEAESHGCDDALLCYRVDGELYIAEHSSTSNIFFAGGRVVVPKRTGTFLYGINIQLAIHLAKQCNMPLDIRPIRLSELYDKRLDAALAIGTAGGWKPIATYKTPLGREIPMDVNNAMMKALIGKRNEVIQIKGYDFPYTP
ncbi:MAG: aminotransferase class IV [Hyphomicrobiales bacterium]|nr:aminotransferase class IV family protein [Rickettsiales bacterium]MCP5361861.1 aminotransferase class IV [Hyphomicrobiales bacterium]